MKELKTKKKIVDYTIVTSYNGKGLIENITDYMKKGWELKGNLFIDKEAGDYEFVHQMVKYE